MRRTIVVHTRLAGHMARVDAARASAHGVQVYTMGQLAGRLAGGLLAPIDPDSLRDAVRDALPASISESSILIGPVLVAIPIECPLCDRTHLTHSSDRIDAGEGDANA